MSRKTLDPLFAEYARTAPLLDLRAYLHYAERHMCDYSIETLAIIQDMVALDALLYRVIVERQKIAGIGSTANQKRLVLALICRFKCSIPQWWTPSVLASKAESEAA